MLRIDRAFFCLAVVLALCFASTGSAQPEKLPLPREVKDPAKPPVKGADPAPQPGKKDDPKENPKLTKFKTITFDRRPSNILKVWNEANSPKQPAKEKPTEPKEPSVGKGPVQEPLDEESTMIQQAVVLGKWDRVKEFIKTFPEKDGEQAYTHLLTGLQRNPNMPMPGMAPGMVDGEMMGPMQGPGGPQQIPPQFMEQNTFSVEDVIGIASACPVKMNEKLLKQLAALLRTTLGQGRGVVETAMKRFSELSKLPENQSPLTRRQFAELLTHAGQAVYAGGFLPTPTEAVKVKDAEALNLLSTHFMALHARDQKASDLEQAWTVTQEALALTDLKQEVREESLKRAVELAPRVKETLGQRWLEESFTHHIDRGREILTTLGTLTSQGIQSKPQGAAERLAELKLQKLAVESLIKAAPKRAVEWKEPLTLLAAAWLKEADFSKQFDRSASLGPRMQYDPWGNMFFQNDDEDMPPYMRQPQMPYQAIRIGEVLETLPSASWLKSIEPEFKPKISVGVANLYLKVKEEAKAFPFIEELAAHHPDKAKTLVSEFLRVWTRNHNLATERQRRNPFIFYYGFERRNEGIPLTRSKQERNLVELSEWVVKLRKLPLGEVDQELLAKAFTSCHSSAEVYRLEAIESVFGPLKSIKPRTLASIIQQMRENLAGVWRDPAAQEDKKTNRKQKDIQQEVVRGYALALTVIEGALKQFPDEWSLTLAKAALIHDEMNYQHEIARSTDYAAKREISMRLFAQAAQQYSAKAKELNDEDQSLLPFEQWFYASVGAVDVRFIDEEKLGDNRQPPVIRKAILSLPGELAEKHMGKFANGLFTKMSGVKPACKFQYLKAGFEIVGEHKQAWEAKKLNEYYKDLVTEIKLEAVIDGSTKVGHKEPFGVFVNLRHTREIERESGGFGRYLQNQNSGRGYFYNYGRPTADYRDKFQASVKEALKEHFEVLSVTFQDEKVNSRSAAEYGWRITPYAYLLLKPHGPQVDKIAPIRMDLDFLDTSGYVVLPISTPTVQIDASSDKGDPRPTRKVQITQILDERQSNQGKLIVEVKATALGVLGDLDELLEIRPSGFEVQQILPQAVSIARFDPEADPTAVSSERTWMVHFQAKNGENPKEFQFGQTKNSQVEMVYQRYNDADLANAEETVALERDYHRRNYTQLAIFIGVGAVVLALLIFAIVRYRQLNRVAKPPRYRLPNTLDVFSVMGLLQRIANENHLTDSERAEMAGTIQILESHYFSGSTNGAGSPDLRTISERWIALGK